MNRDLPPSRRAALRAGALLAGSGCVCAATTNTCCSTPVLPAECITYTETSAIIDLSKTDALGAAGTAANLIDENRKLDLILVRSGADRYHVLSGLCTHYPRPVSYNHARRVVQCNNFNHSTYELDGTVRKGPAPQPLRSYRVRRTEGRLEVSLS
jgi:Rieske Fe-S protein